MAIEIIDLGTVAQDGADGDVAREAFEKVNANFAEHESEIDALAPRVTTVENEVGQLEIQAGQIQGDLTNLTESFNLLSSEVGSNTADIQNLENSREYTLVPGEGITIDRSTPTAPIISSTGSSGSVWGQITGDITDQADLFDLLQDRATVDSLEIVEGKVDRILSSTSVNEGAGAVPYNEALEYPAGSVGAAVKAGGSQLREDLASGDAEVSPDSVTGLSDNLADIYRLHPLQNSIAAVTVYCDPVTGNDSNPGTLAQPFRTFQRAIDGCPRILTHQYVIDLKASAVARGGLPVFYDEDVVIRDIHGPMTNPAVPGLVSSALRVSGAGANTGVDAPSNVKVGSLTISGCSGIANPEILGMTATRISPYYEKLEYIAIYGTQGAQLYNVAFEGGDATKAGVRPYGSGLSLKGIDVTGLLYGVWAKRGGNTVVSGAYGVQSPGSTYRADEGSIISIIDPDDVTGRADSRGLFNQNYGLVHGAQGINFNRAMYYGAPALGTTLGQDALALGYLVTATGVQALAAGRQSIASGLNAVALGTGAIASGDNSFALGNGAQAAHSNSAAIGNGAVAPAANRMRLGSAGLAAVETQNALEVLGAGGALFLCSPNGTRYRLRVSDAGALVIAAVPA